MVDRRLLSVMLAICVCWVGLPNAVFAGAGAESTAARVVAFPTAECAQFAWYVGQMQAIGFDDQADDDEDVSTWTAPKYDAEIARYDFRTWPSSTRSNLLRPHRHSTKPFEMVLCCTR